MHFPAPDFIAEILPPFTARHDRGIKKCDNVVHGVAEYWLVDPVAQTVDPLTFHGDDYRSTSPLQGDGAFASTTIFGFNVLVRAFFEQKANVAALTALRSARRRRADPFAYANNVSTANPPPVTSTCAMVSPRP